MKKYFFVIKNTWAEVLTYRLNFVMWRVRVVIQFLTIYLLWLSILPQNSNFQGYTQSLMLTYILGTSIVGAIVLSTRTADIAQDINRGNLSNFLIRPINYFIYWFSKDLGDKAMNIILMAFELTLFFIIFNPPFFLQTNPIYLTFFAVALLFALTLHFFISFLLSLIGFWSPETWAPRFIFVIILTFFAGSLFPLDILPENIFSIIEFFPFTYLLYFPLKIYLGDLPTQEIYSGLLISFAWVIFFYATTRLVWSRGLKIYTAQGK